jgi:predicted transcriptional regulator
MSPATVQNIEKGAFSPRLDIIQKILEQLDARMTITMKEGD